MKLGYIYMGLQEQEKALQVIRLLNERVAMDELGIGRIRDFFSNKMFPGVSTLQTHLKYFSLIPQVYRKAIETRYNRLSEVKTEIIPLERLMTQVLCACSDDTESIIGSGAMRNLPSNGKGEILKHTTMEIKRTILITALAFGVPAALMAQGKARN